MKNLSLRAKLTLMFLALALASLGVFGGITLIRSSRIAEDLLFDKLDSDANSLTLLAAAQIDPNDVYELLESGEEGDEQYVALQDQLNAIMTSNPHIAPGRMFIAVPGDSPGEVVFVVDTQTNPVEHFVLGDNYEPEEWDRILDGFDGVLVNEELIEDEQGNWFVAGYGPLHEVPGESEAIVGVDLSAESLYDASDSVIFGFAITAVFLIPVIVGVVLLLAGAISKPVMAITDAAEVVDTGEEYKESMLEKVAARSDELGQLARVFSRMAIDVQARERQLKSQVKELEIQIDLVKQNSQVSEIVDSDFFKDLKSKAKQMREESDEEVGAS